MKWPVCPVVAGTVAAALLLALPGCTSEPTQTQGESSAAPLLWEIKGPNGDAEGWLFGTIHALPKGTHWRTPLLDRAIRQADLLVVEVAGLDDQRAMAQVFARLSTSPALPDIALRVPPSARAGLFDLIERADQSASDFAGTETWAVALILAQVDSGGDSANGADRALLQDFAGRKVRELEGAQKQLEIFDALPEKEQRDLLLAVMEEIRANQADPARLQRAWLAGDADTLEQAASSGLMEDPELRETLLVRRNRNWMQQLRPILASGKRPLVAVGTAHLLGPDGLPAMFEALGYSVRRIP